MRLYKRGKYLRSQEVACMSTINDGGYIDCPDRYFAEKVSIVP